MAKHEGAILDYCKKHKMNIAKLSEFTGVSINELHKLNRDKRKNLKIETIERLYKATNSITNFTDPLIPDMYLDYEVLKYKKIN